VIKMFYTRFTDKWFKKDEWTYDFSETESNKYRCVLKSIMQEKSFESVIKYILERQKKINVKIEYDKIGTFKLDKKQEGLAFKAIKGMLGKLMGFVFSEVRKDGINPLDYDVVDLVYQKNNKTNMRTIVLTVEGNFTVIKK
jgi:hypothetical protein